mgnify:CR=1 FL=1
MRTFRARSSRSSTSSPTRSSSRRWTTAAGCAPWRRRRSRGSSKFPRLFKCGKYCLLFDPLDGSSNIDVNVPVGTIFSVVKKITRGRHGELEDMLQPGRRQVAAGLRDLRLEHDDGLHHGAGRARLHARSVHRRVPALASEHQDPRRRAGISPSTIPTSSCGTTTFAPSCGSTRDSTATVRALSTRYVGSLVADFHRNLLGGGIFAYPANKKTPKGKLRLLYEANPLAFIVEQAGGAATDGIAAHPRHRSRRSCTSASPLYIGSKNEVDLARQMLSVGSGARWGVASEQPSRAS